MNLKKTDGTEPRRPRFASAIDGTDVDLKQCGACAHHETTEVFDLCKHASSKYTIAGEDDFHTIGHMRTIGACGGGAVLFEKINLTPLISMRG